MINIRPAMISDAKAIARVHVNSWQAIYRGHIPDHVLDQLSVDERSKVWFSLLKDNVKVWVAEENNNIVGFISICQSRDPGVDPKKKVAEISAIYLHSQFWRQGLGQLLCNTVIAALKKLGYNEVTLWVLDANQQAKQFYEKMGFIKTKKVKVEQAEEYTFHEVQYKKNID